MPTVTERLDDLFLDDMKIYQRSDQFCLSLDAVLLAHYARPMSGRSYIDLGTGTGALALMLSSLGATSVTAVELNPVMADLARRNVELNGRDDRITVVEGDYRALSDRRMHGAFAGAVVNPPYRVVGSGPVSSKEGVARAMHEETATLGDVTAAARTLVKYGGFLWMVHLAERTPDVFEALRKADFEPKRVRFVHSKPGGRAKFILIEARYGGHAGTEIEAPLFIYGEDGSYTEEVRRIYGRKDG